MKATMIVIVGIVVVAIAVVGIFSISQLQAGTPSCGPTWRCATAYPVLTAGMQGVAGEGCLANGTNIYCIGGIDANGVPHNDVYRAPVSSVGNITGWTLGPDSYPQNVSGESCLASGGYLYCVGGFHDATADDTADSYYAQLTSGGDVGPWYYTTPYPVPVDSVACVGASSYIYCIAGNNETDGTNGTVAPSDSAWYAHLSASGIGEWTRTTSYPANTFLPSCSEDNGFVYCLGGTDPNGSPVGTAYFARLSTTGIGQWVPTADYPLPSTGEACATAMGYIYCVGGATTGGQTRSYTSAVYYATISSKGIGIWKAGPDYPRGVATTCAVSTSRLYCVGGFDGSPQGENDWVRYASLGLIRASP